MKFEMPPTAAGCFGNAPLQPSVWFDQRTLQLYHNLRMSGTSMSAFTESLNAAAQDLAWRNPGANSWPRIDDRALEEAYHHYRTTLHDFTDPSRMVSADDFRPGPLGSCPVCALSHEHACAVLEMTDHRVDVHKSFQEWYRKRHDQIRQMIFGTTSTIPGCPAVDNVQLNGLPDSDAQLLADDADDEPHQAAGAAATVSAAQPMANSDPNGPQPPSPTPHLHSCILGHAVKLFGILGRGLLVVADAVMKLSHYSNCGRTHTAVCNQLHYHPKIETFVTVANTQKLEELQRQAGVRQDDDVDYVCQADLSCARAAPCKGGAVTDIKCTAGMVCTHVVPARGLFIQSSSPEHFMLYDVLLLTLLDRLAEQNQQLKGFLLDINCRFSSHFKHFIQRNFPDVNAYAYVGATSFLWMIGWLHSKAGHNLQCQLDFSALFKDGTGRCIGEQCEQLWVSPVTA
jgi:Kyakuja-Dileera-Zisupton transposase